MRKASKLPKLSKTSNLKRIRAIKKQKIVSRDNIGKIYETIFTFPMKYCNTGKLFIFQHFCAGVKKILSSEGRQGTRLYIYAAEKFS